MQERLDPKYFTDVLLSDVVASQERLEAHDSPQNRRDLVRTAMSGAEGLIWFLKVRLFARPRVKWKLTLHEYDALFEQGYVVAENGAVRVTSKHLPTATTLKLIARIIRRQFPEFSEDFSDDKWRRVLTAIAVRHRLTHPKSIDDLQVSDEDVECASYAFRWMLAYVLRALASGAMGELPKDPEDSTQVEG